MKINLLGQIFHRLTVLHETSPQIRSNGKSRRMWTCLCNCGHQTNVEQSKLTSGHTKSCGCYNKEMIGSVNKKHGRYKHPLYNVWLGMHQRCYLRTHHKYPRYGGRGITICNRWHDIENFILDMSPRPSSLHTVDRIDNNSNYSPNNCHWATPREQADNKGKYHVLTFNDKSQAVYKWAEELHIKYSTLSSRILCYQWSVKKALTTPVAKRVKRA